MALKGVGPSPTVIEASLQHFEREYCVNIHPLTPVVLIAMVNTTSTEYYDVPLLILNKTITHNYTHWQLVPVLSFISAI